MATTSLNNPVRVFEHTEVLTLAGQTFVVGDGGRLVVRGSGPGAVEVDPGGQAWVFGTIVGNVVNHGGLVVVVGRIEGDLTTDGGTSRVLPDAKVQTVTTLRGELIMATDYGAVMPSPGVTRR
jgi:hypothetical protein